MSDYMIKTNQKRCISCKACEVHCKVKYNVPPGAKLGQLVSVGPVVKKNKPGYLTLFMPCFHCEIPWCVSACPTGAVQQREKDGIVFIQQELCVGCKACIIACPWNIPQWDQVNGRAIKCDFCMDRVDEGLDPACVTGCTAHALSFIKPGEASEQTRRDFAAELLLSEHNKV